MSRTIYDKMSSADVPARRIDAFIDSVDRIRDGQHALLPESTIAPVRSLPLLEELSSSKPQRADLVAQLAIIKLNGGLGTSMGLHRAKSLLSLRDGDCFLDLIARQVVNLRALSASRSPAFYLMNSFSTHEDTVRYLTKYSAQGLSEDVTFVQGKVPKIDAHTLEPMCWPRQPELEWCPPGHGDLYPSLLASGVLERLLRDDVQYLFVSNADNLGASVDLTILEHLAETDLSFLMEVTDRTSSDTKGGHLARGMESGRLLLRELAQCPPDDLAAFRDTERHRYFNTNNLWIRLEDLKSELDRHDGQLALPMFANRKTVDPRDPESPEILQLESAVGAGISAFERSGAIVVPRSRFAPVKTTTDLLAIRSDAYCETSSGCLILDDSRHGERPVVDLDQTMYKKIDDFEAAFPHGVPSLLRCDSLRISGRWVFGADVVCEGHVDLTNGSCQVQHVARGTRFGSAGRRACT